MEPRVWVNGLGFGTIKATGDHQLLIAFDPGQGTPNASWIDESECDGVVKDESGRCELASGRVVLHGQLELPGTQGG